MPHTAGRYIAGDRGAFDTEVGPPAVDNSPQSSTAPTCPLWEAAASHWDGSTVAMLAEISGCSVTEFLDRYEKER